MTPEQAYLHCVIRGRNAELENIIATSPEWAFYYAQNLIKGRWIEAENIIAKKSNWAFYYAKYVIKSKLPENMHNMMLLHADEWAKYYLNLLII